MEQVVLESDSPLLLRLLLLLLLLRLAGEAAVAFFRRLSRYSCWDCAITRAMMSSSSQSLHRPANTRFGSGGGAEQQKMLVCAIGGVTQKVQRFFDHQDIGRA